MQGTTTANNNNNSPTCMPCPRDTYQDATSHLEAQCLDQPTCKLGQFISPEVVAKDAVRTCKQCPIWSFQPSPSHRETECQEASVTTCNNAGNFNPGTGGCDCFDGYGGDDCSDVAAGCRQVDSALASALEEEANTNLVEVLPPVAGISATSVVVAYAFLLNGGDPAGATSFAKLKWRAHAWAFMSVGLKILDLQTDLSFYFVSLSGEPFESQFMDGGVRRFTQTGRYNSNVRAVQTVSLVSCSIGSLFTFLDMYGTHQRLAGIVTTARKITLGVMVFEDFPQLVINIIYMKTVDEIDPISIVSLVASIFNILYSVYLIYSDRRIAAKQHLDEGEDNETEIESGAAMSPYRPSNSTFNNPAFSKSAKPPSSQQTRNERCKTCNAKTTVGCMCNVRRNTAEMMGRPIMKVKGNAETKANSKGKPRTKQRAARTTTENKKTSKKSGKKHVHRVKMVTIAGFRTSDVGKACSIIGVGSGIIRFVGLHAEDQTPRVGVEMNKPKGINDGTVKGNKYFECKDGFGVLTHPSKVTIKATSSTTKPKTQNHTSDEC